jgi:hypothetical protein
LPSHDRGQCTCDRFPPGEADIRFARALLAAGAASLWLGATAHAQGKVEVVQEWGAYYSSVGLYIPTSDDPLPEGGQLSETEVYRQLFERSYRPNVIALEASVYPMPILGVWMRGHAAGFYDSMNVAGDLNLIQAVTAGFQEPWAVSAFFGSQMKFSRAGESGRDANRGYMGYLVSGGTKHIKNNVLIDDDWIEAEWKLKGERIFEQDRLSWSFRAGAKLNRNANIADTLYLGFRRSNLDFKSPFLSFLDNSRIDLFTEIGSNRPTLLRQELIFGKKYPMSDARMAWELDFGVIYERASKYTGELAPLAKTGYTLVFRPNIVF